MYDFLQPLRANYRPQRTGRAAERYADHCRRLCEARSEAAIDSEAAGGSPAPARTPRRSASTASAKKDGGSDDGDGPARRRVQPLFYDLQDVAEAVALSPSGVQAMVRAGDFPKPRLLSARRVAWLAREVEQWCEDRPVASCLPQVNAGLRRAS
jgi:predicted DNA-binding transcriptional regulator AlpA